MPALSIRLIRTPIVWLADFSYYQPLSDRMRAVGLPAIVPLPWTGDASEDVVIADVRDRYPLASLTIERRNP